MGAPNQTLQQTGAATFGFWRSSLTEAAPVAELVRYRAEQSSAFLAGCKSLPGKG
jgi:hypothetical protein